MGAAGPCLVGVDGCRAGWVAIVETDRGPTEVVVVATFADVLALGGDVVGVDMPIGLAERGPRACDVEARARLGPRRSSVFPAPVRDVLGAADHRDAVARSRAATGKGVSVQTWNLVAKILDVDSNVAPGDPVFEVHPELSLATLAGAPLTTRKKTPEGRAERLDLLVGPFPDVAERLAAKPSGCAPDDVVDAYAVLWTTRRIAEGTAVTLGDGACDARGLVMAVTA